MLAVRMSSVALACDTASMSVSRLGIVPSSDYPDHILENGTYTPYTLAMLGILFLDRTWHLPTRTTSLPGSL